MKEINDKTLFRYFSAKSTTEEEHDINEWLLQDEGNVRKLKESYSLWETLLFSGSGNNEEEHMSATRRHRKPLRSIMLAVANIAALLVFFLIAGYVMHRTDAARLATTMNTIEIPAGGKMDITLSDGTKVCLNAGASISYPMRFSRRFREVSVKGEAYFNVAHDENKPFIVKTLLSDIEVLGTKFNVNSDEESRHLSVALLEGSIKLCGDAGEKLMSPGQKVEIKDGQFLCESYNTTKDTRWMNGILDISGLAFSEIMKKMENAFGVKIVIERTNIPEIGFKEAELHQSEGVESALKSLQYAGVDFRYVNDFKTGVIYIR